MYKESGFSVGVTYLLFKNYLPQTELWNFSLPTSLTLTTQVRLFRDVKERYKFMIFYSKYLALTDMHGTAWSQNYPLSWNVFYRDVLVFNNFVLLSDSWSLMLSVSPLISLWTWYTCWLAARSAANLCFSNPSTCGKEVEAEGCAPVLLTRLEVCVLSQSINFLIFLTCCFASTSSPYIKHQYQKSCSLLKPQSWWSVLLARGSQVHMLVSGSVLSYIPIKWSIIC